MSASGMNNGAIEWSGQTILQFLKQSYEKKTAKMKSPRKVKKSPRKVKKSPRQTRKSVRQQNYVHK
jgi:hypothetical protein